MINIKEKNSECGAALVELAIVLPFLLLLLVGLIELGLLFYNQQVLTNASREGARAGIGFYLVPPAPNPRLSEDEIKAVVRNYCTNRLIRFNAATSPTPLVDGEGGNYLETLTVTVSYNYTFLFPEMLGFTTNMQLVAETEMMMELAPGT
jgi:Flp pilus assembly protein TadG